MKLELELAQSYGEELSKKLNSHERKIKSLTEDLNQANENIKEAETKHKATMEIKDKEIDALIEKIKNITVTNEKGNKYMVCYNDAIPFYVVTFIIRMKCGNF